MNLAIIIVGFNSKKYLSDCLRALRKADKTDKTKVFFIDNDSSDESVLFIRKNFPEVMVIESKKNLGFAGGNNLGIEEAIKTGADHILLLNPDTIIDQNCLKVLESKADTQTILQPLILLHLDGKMTDLVNTSGNHLNFLGCLLYTSPSPRD